MAADTTYPSVVQIRQDGNLAVPTGKSIDIESGGSIKIAGTAITATAAEINAIAGGGLSGAELGVLDGVTAGTGVASKALVLDSSGNLAMPAAPASIDQRNAEIVTSTNVILAAENGRTYHLDNATGFVSTLPAAALGLSFTFIIKTAVTTTGGHTIVCPAAAALFKGHVLTNDLNSATDADFGTSGEATVTFVINKAIAGDRVRVDCDGTNWFVHAACSVFDAITIS